MATGDMAVDFHRERNLRFLGFFHGRVCIFSVFGSMIIKEDYYEKYRTRQWRKLQKIGNLSESLVVVIHGWQREPTDGSKGGWSVGLSICLSVCLSIYLSVCLSIYLSVYLSIYLSTYLSIYLSASLNTKLFCETSLKVGS